MRKTYFNLLTLICLIFVTGCFNEEKGNTKKVGNAKITNKSDYLSVAFDKNILGAELHINGKIDEDKIKTSGDVKKFVINREGETIVLFAGNNIPAKGEAVKIFGADIASVTGANGVDTVNGGNSKKRAAATDAHILLGDTDANDTVNISDFIKFAQSYGYAKGDAGYDAKCDIAPAEKGVLAGWEDIYAIATADSKVDIFDFIVFAQNYGKSKPTTQLVYTTQEKLQGYTVTTNAISFLFDTETFKSQLSVGAIVTNVNVAGSFNGWNSTSADWKTVATSSGTVFTIEKVNANVTIPGNSGHPEFKFVVTTKEADGTVKSGQWMQPPTALEVGYKFFQKTNDYNTLVVFPTDNVAEIVADNKIAMTIKTSESEFTSVEDLSNFRAVETGSLGEKRLFRGYHPFIASRATDAQLKDIEAIKIKKVQELMTANGIKSVINLSDMVGEITGNVGTFALYKDAYAANNVLSYVTSYNVVYYGSNGTDFAKLMKTVTGFVMTHDAPFMVHCRLGTDRTGAVTAFLEGIMGATWKEISDDYKRSNNQYFKEFRSERLLKYSIERMLNITLTDSTKIDVEIANYLKTNPNILYTDDDIAKIKAKLGK